MPYNYICKMEIGITLNFKHGERYAQFTSLLFNLHIRKTVHWQNGVIDPFVQ